MHQSKDDFELYANNFKLNMDAITVYDIGSLVNALRKKLISIVKQLFASINKILILEGSLWNRL